MTNTRFWSGLETIGGNIVEVSTEKARVICDFGLAVADNTKDPLKSGSELEKAIAKGTLPPVPGLYDTNGFESLLLEGAEENTKETALFISHLHLDHMGGLRFLPKDTTVYLSEDSYKLFHLLIAVEEDVSVACTVKSFKEREVVTVGDVSVEAHLSDHDARGTCAFFIQSPDVKLIHSGDFRLDGRHPERVMNWAMKANAWQPDVLLIEGTSFSFDESELNTHEKLSDKPVYTEESLRVELSRMLENEKAGLLAINPYIRNVERLLDIEDCVAASKRTMVWEAPYAYVLSGFYPGRKWTILAETASDPVMANLETESISIEAIHQQPEAFVLQNSFKNLELLGTFSGALYLHSNGEPLGDYDPRYQLMLDFLEEAQITFQSFGASGHATREALVEIAQVVDAELTIPWHTFSPQHFYDALTAEGLSSFLPEYGQDYRFQQMIRQMN
ncbi:hypothetical protein ADIAL_0409 [Alkalibacterium sp. AK22]|uniref:MBL fold metallo-hydrolase n=1 Tax=Alkalibacterium sp. AK22 TaxID=1229520 RepID=UPI0004518A94|nr:MBL fold metallo-hydrolase [Alkalibacterium sp. AK22]EXJ24098.1 hypothetical protein ADIAL_0409 [Alkalibacterium sp. AK22]